MSKATRRNDRGQFARKHAKAYVLGSWISALVSLVLLWLASRAFDSDIGSFRHCATDGNNLFIHNCGKTTLNPGDFVLFGLFIASACLAFSLLTNLWRINKSHFSGLKRGTA